MNNRFCYFISESCVSPDRACQDSGLFCFSFCCLLLFIFLVARLFLVSLIAYPPLYSVFLCQSLGWSCYLLVSAAVIVLYYVVLLFFTVAVFTVSMCQLHACLFTLFTPCLPW